MFAIPKIGQRISVTTDWTTYLKPFVSHIPRQKTTTGKVVHSENWDNPNTFRMTTGNSDYPVAIIPLTYVIKLIDAGGVEADANAVANVDDEYNTWEVDGSTGNTYTVTQIGNRWSCSCKGFMFRKSCKHIGQFREA